MIKRHSTFLFALLILVLVYWTWWLPGTRVANDFPEVSLSELIDQFDLPHAWNSRGAEGFGQYSVFTLWSWPLTFVSGLLAKFGLNFEVQERVLLVVPILVLGCFGLGKVLSELKLGK